ncbi:hypothetical protein ACNDVI_001985, partial [Escherichia coli]
ITITLVNIPWVTKINFPHNSLPLGLFYLFAASFNIVMVINIFSSYFSMFILMSYSQIKINIPSSMAHSSISITTSSLPMTNSHIEPSSPIVFSVPFISL